MNLEYFQIMGKLNQLKGDLLFMVFTVSSDIISDENSWFGFVSAIKKSIDRNTLKLREHMLSIFN